jgi:glycyl-tRNA synthetase
MWWKAMTKRQDIVGLDAAILMHPTTWKASGHVDGFTDPLVECKDCKSRFRVDQLKTPGVCNSCEKKNLSEPKNFNLMFKTFMGPVEETAAVVFLRPETAQGIFVNFENVQVTARKKIPFGIAQIGKAFRNEITPGNFIFRTREFEQMEMQYFVKPGTDMELFESWKLDRKKYYESFGFRSENLRFHQHGDGELAHYARAAFDIQYKFPIGWQEIEGIHNRSDFDLTQHQKFSGKKLEYFDDQTKEKFVPFVIETSAGCDRTLLATLCDAYREEVVADEENPGKEDVRIVLGFDPRLSPVKVAVLPLSKKAELQEITHKIRDELSEDMVVQYDDAASIGKRYRRQDEIGTPFCLTVDFETLQDKCVTIRHRDTMKQVRITMDGLSAYIKTQMKNFKGSEWTK